MPKSEAIGKSTGEDAAKKWPLSLTRSLENLRGNANNHAAPIALYGGCEEAAGAPIAGTHIRFAPNPWVRATAVISLRLA